jgi:hypothetical protein
MDSAPVLHTFQNPEWISSLYFGPRSKRWSRISYTTPVPLLLNNYYIVTYIMWHSTSTKSKLCPFKEGLTCWSTTINCVNSLPSIPTHLKDLGVFLDSMFHFRNYVSYVFSHCINLLPCDELITHPRSPTECLRSSKPKWNREFHRGVSLGPNRSCSAKGKKNSFAGSNSQRKLSSPAMFSLYMYYILHCLDLSLSTPLFTIVLRLLMPTNKDKSSSS